MHLGIDVREACAPQRTGKGQWTYGFVSELLRRDSALTLYTDKALPPEWNQLVTEYPKRLHVEENQSSGLSWHWQTAQHVRQSSSIDLYVSTVSYIVPVLLGAKKPVVTVVHDLIAFQNEPHDRKATFIERLTLHRAAKKSKLICTVSESTKLDLLKKYPDLSPASITSIFAGPVTTDTPSYTPDGKTILCIATLCPRKNQLRLIEAFANLPAGLRAASRLVLVGKRGWDDEDIVRLAQSTPGVEWKNYLSDSECEALMRTATVFAFPSLYEGFGMPVLDAMRHGIPVLVSDRGSLKEVAGDSAYSVDPEKIEDIAKGLQTLLSNADMRDALSEKGKKQAAHFSWKRTVDLFLQAL